MPPPSPALRPVTRGSRNSIPQLFGLVDAHDGWQRVDRALMAAEAVPVGTPAERVPRWEQVKTMLARLCPAGAAADPMTDPAILARRWESATVPKQAENLFLSLRAAVGKNFKNIDDRLLTLSGELILTIDPLDALLLVI